MTKNYGMEELKTNIEIVNEENKIKVNKNKEKIINYSYIKNK